MSSTIVATRDYTFPRDFHHTHNSSAAPLPLIPRRPSSTPSSRRTSPLATPSADTFFTRNQTPKTPTSAPATTVFVVEPPTPAEGNNEAGSSSTWTGQSSSSTSPTSSDFNSSSTVRPKRIRGQRFHSQRTADPDSDSDTPRLARGSRTTATSHSREPAISRATTSGGKVRGSLDSVRYMSESHVHTLAAAESRVQAVAAAAVALEVSPGSSVSTSPSMDSTFSKLVRKKSGEPLKSSLKVKRAGVRGSLTIVTDPQSAVPALSKSAPATPSVKNVHFDAQDHVKLFLAEQKPLAVSRDGSPTDTSGTDNEFPSFIYGKDEQDTDRVLTMHKVNVPKEIDPAADVALERLELAAEIPAVNGVVRVRNLAFEKWVAVRFTMDFWQTTSEVTARYVDSVEDGKFDRFAFVIKLHDVLARAEEKTLFLAVRYTVEGREIWDSNGGANYQVKIVREKVQPKEEEVVPAPKKAAASSGSGSGSGSEMEHLHSKLLKVAQGRASEATVGSLLSQRRWDSPVPSPSSVDSKPPNFKAQDGFNSRYSFRESLRNSWQTPASPHSRTSTYPASNSANSIPWPVHSPVDYKPFAPTPTSTPHRGGPRVYMPQGSPRDAGDEYRPSAYFQDSDLDTDDMITLVPSLKRNGNRHHQRGGFFDEDAAHAAGCKRTPPTSPFASPVVPTASLPQAIPVPAQQYTPAPVQQQSTPPSFPRYNSFPPTDGPSRSPRAYNSPIISHHWAAAMRQAGSEDSTPSITSPSSESSSRSASPSLDEAPQTLQSTGQRASSLGNIELATLVKQYCFFTGADPESLTRSHSASSIEEFLSAGQTPPLGSYGYHSPSPFSTPVQARSPASDDELVRSGSTTPTAHSVYKAHTLPRTPPLRV
ncbi:hypothetical protein BV25DRAFT_690535 [Artomyces pyxidatus]|uniref:Uncharacterized protein n=1 Tax=Artomyces pyxidatus TaxID=48021 RepID=A0ACB8T063_9AGAM|nr:hypothetical protein BV25DRAFT_690535 [Artomyces pyxidatus]